MGRQRAVNEDISTLTCTRDRAVESIGKAGLPPARGEPDRHHPACRQATDVQCQTTDVRSSGKLGSLSRPRLQFLRHRLEANLPPLLALSDTVYLMYMYVHVHVSLFLPSLPLIVFIP